MPLLNQLAKCFLDAVYLGPSFPLRHVSALAGRRLHHTRLRRGGPIALRPKTSDAETFIDIFRRGAYDFSWLKQYERVLQAHRRIRASGRSPVIVDAGANVGAATLWFCETFPEVKIYAIEPDADNAEVLRLNTRRRPNVEVVEAAIGCREGSVSLHNPDKQAWAIQTERDAGGPVAVVTIPSLLKRNEALFLVKIDIEGFESDLFQSNLDWLDDVEVVIIEPHDWMHPGAGTSRNFQHAMLDRSFEMIISGENLIYLRV